MSSAQGLMWTEKYRPKKLDDLIDQEEAKRSLINLLRSPSEMPHLLFSGPAGSGKTTTAVCIARAILGDHVSDALLSLNASDERTLKQMREKVKTFAKYVVTKDVSFKIIILDEADEMDRLAQPALRRIMEDFSEFNRFIFLCNYSSGIIGPIQSRCAIFRFVRLPQESVVKHLAEICKKEKVKYEPDSLTDIYAATDGDMRHAINVLQTCASYDEVNQKVVEKVLGLTPAFRVGKIIDQAIEGAFSKARNEMVDLLRVYGMPEQDILRYAYNAVLKKDVDHAGAAEIFAKYDSRLSSGGSTPEIQLASLLAELVRLAKSKTSS